LKAGPRIALLGLALLAHGAGAHELSMAEMEMRQISAGEFLWQWTASGAKPAAQEAHAGVAGGLRERAREQPPALRRKRPERHHEGRRRRQAVFCGDSPGVLARRQTRVYTMTSGQPAARLYGSADDRRGTGEIASAYTVLGVEHILSGYDHLMFVFALLFLVGFNKRLVWTITAFTAAHSVTLALAALGLLTLRSPPVEATIALSIVLVAGEALHTKATLARRWPALVAFLFGLVPRPGLRGALKDIGLPQNHLPVALLTFNVGVELASSSSWAWLTPRGGR